MLSHNDIFHHSNFILYSTNHTYPVISVTYVSLTPNPESKFVKDKVHAFHFSIVYTMIQAEHNKITLKMYHKLGKPTLPILLLPNNASRMNPKGDINVTMQSSQCKHDHKEDSSCYLSFLDSHQQNEKMFQAL